MKAIIQILAAVSGCLVTHVHPACSPTLLIHGEHDLMAPVKSTRILHARLEEEKVLTVLHILPQTDHAFDLIMPNISPSAYTAFYDVERFLALQIKTLETPEVISKGKDEYQLDH